MSAQVVAHGSTGTRRWRLVRAEGALRLHLRTALFERVVLVVLLLAPGFPVLFLLELAREAPRIGPSVRATVATLAWIFVFVGAMRLCRRERVTLSADGLLVERRGLFRWRGELVDVSDGADVSSANHFLVELRRAVAVDAGGRCVRFGTLLSGQEAARIRERLRAALASEGSSFDAADGVVRRVATRSAPDVPPGAADLLVLTNRQPSVVGGVLRPESALTRMGGALYLLAVFACVFWVVVSALTGVAAWATLVVLLVLGGVGGREGLVERIVRRRAQRRLRERPEEPWDAVGVWRGGVIARSPARRVGGPLLLAAVLGGVAVFAAMRASWPPSTGQGIFLGVLGLLALAPVFRVQNVLFQGTTEVRLRQMPYRTPGEVVLDFAVSRRGASFDTLRFTLQRVVEVRSWRRSVVGLSHVGTYVPPADRELLDPGGQIEARFTLGDGVPGTHLDGPEPAFWELLVEGLTSCGWYSESFPVPVYDEPT